MKNNKKFIPLNVQLFADNGSTDNAPAESGASETTTQVESQKEEKTYTRDELNVMLNAERKKAKEEGKNEALAEAKKKADAEKTEAEKLAKMSEDEKHNYELEKERKEKNEAISKLNAYELKEQATKIASEKEMDISLLNLIDYSNETADTVKNKLETIDSVIKKAVEKGINERLREKSPRQVSSPITSSDKDYLDKKYGKNPYYKK